MATPDLVQAVVDASLDTWKRQLLDLTRRNRALNFRALKVSTIAVVNEQPAEIYRLLYDEERALTFAAAPQPPPPASSPTRPLPNAAASSPDAGETADPFDDAEHAPEGRTFEPYAPDSLPGMHLDTLLQTNLEPEALDRSLRRIEEQARLSLEEQGVNTLFLALGLLHYTEAEASDEIFKAPLVLLPVSLRRESARSPFVLTVGDDEPMVNPALAELMRRQHNLALPDLPTGDDASLQSFFVHAQASLDALPVARAEPRWRITSDIYIGLFSFQKLVMYKDLEANAAAVTQHRLVHQLITRRGTVSGGGLGLPDDVRNASLDDEYPPEQGAHVVDADGSQQRALAAAERGYDLVVEGPPGTGKSQTITNLVAQTLHAGKTVLFVAEKMAALDVVHQRLQQAGLGEFCLELHSTRSSKREVIKSIAAALDASLQRAATPGDAASRLPDVRATLGDYVSALHEPFGAIETTPFSAYGQLAAVLDAPRLDWTGDPVRVTQSALDMTGARLQSLAAAAAAAGEIATHPWRDTARTFYPQDQLDAVVEAARAVEARVPPVQAATRDAAAVLGLPGLESLADRQRVRDVADLLRHSPGAPRDVIDSDDWNAAVPREALDLIDKVREAQRLAGEARARFLPNVLQGDHAGDIAYMDRRSGVLASHFWWLDARHREIRARWRAQRQPSYAPSFRQHAHDLESVVRLRETTAAIEAAHGRGIALFGPHWQGTASDVGRLEAYGRWVTSLRQVHARTPISEVAMGLAARGHVDMTAADRLEELAAELTAAVERVAGLVQWRSDRPALVSLPLAELQSRAAGLIGQSHRAARWGAFVAATQEARETIAARLVDLAEANRIGYGELPRAWRRAFWFAWLARCLEARPALARFHALTHEQRVQEFRDLDRRVLADNRARLVTSLRIRVQASLRNEAVEAVMPILRREMAKQRNHRPIRETLRQAAPAVRAIKPVFLMSPLSVAQFTRGDTPTFDLVVFDEASQLPPEDAIGSIVRGGQLVVVGDPKQLPPTTFFATTHEAPSLASGDEGVEVPDAESILEAFMGCGVPMSRLKWHYRSAHESLISFSNVSFYDGDLLTFPSVEAMSDRLGLRFEHVSDGVYEGKGLNLAEARRVADAVALFAREQLAGARAGVPPRSLGVGTFNLRQQLAIQDLLEQRRRDEPDIEPFFDRSRDEPFFVKNLENIQGDERDVIFLSVTYAKGRDGRLRQNFGPLNGDNGWRRLNVLTTRARRAMRVFSSMRASDIHEGQSKGGPLLKGFLEYAESGRLDHPSLVAAALTESPFEREVVADLTRRGYLVQPQVGVTGYRIDIGVRDPDAPGRYLLGIECDGVAYHASDTARDRDRLRQQVLETRGWTIVRLWSTDWFKDRAGQMERLEQAIADAAALRDARDAAKLNTVASAYHDRGTSPAATSVGSEAAPVVGSDNDQAAGSGDGARADPSRRVAAGLVRQIAQRSPADSCDTPLAYEKASPPDPLAATGVLDCDLSALSRIVATIVSVETPVHEDDVVARVSGFWGQRAGARIRAHVLAACDAAIRGKAVERRGEFLWRPEAHVRVRDRSDSGIGADRIAPEEYDAALRMVLARGQPVRHEALQAEARTLLGFERTGSTLSAALDAAIGRLLANGEIGEGSAGYRLLHPPPSS